MQYIREALAANEEMEYLITKAQILSYMGRFGEAEAELKIGLQEDPASFQLHATLMNNYVNEKNFEKIKKAAETLKLFVDDPENNLLLDYSIAEATRFSGDSDKAADYYAKILATIDSLDLKNNNIYGPMILSVTGKPDEAMERMKSIMDNDSTEVEKHSNLYNLICLYSRIGKKNEALDLLEKFFGESKTAIEYFHALYDYDLDILRDDPRYKEIMEEYDPMSVTETAIVDANLVRPIEGIQYVDAIEDSESITEEVPFTYENGVTKVKCEINGLPLYFVFDTGASDVTLSAVEANFMLKNNYISPRDFVGKSRYMDANGDISEGAVLILKNVNFGGFHLDNVRASVVKSQRAPLLLGQSVLSRLGSIEIDNSKKVLKITHVKNQ